MSSGIGAESAGRQAVRTTVIRGISTAASGSAVVVTIDATGALQPPTTGVIETPPRIYVDFHGVALKAPRVIASVDPRILRIRAGVHSAAPLVTRVVLDLATLQPYRLELGNGRVSVIVGESQGPPSPGIAPVPPLPERAPPPRAIGEAPREPLPSRGPTPAAPPTPGPDRTVTSAPASAPAPAHIPAPAPPPNRLPEKGPAPARSTSRSAPGQTPSVQDLERYRRQVSGALDRLRVQQPLLTSLDAAEDQTVDRVQLGVEEFERLKRELAGIKPPDSLRSQHDLLFQSATLALMATRLRLEAFRTSDPATLRNAASAAAGASLLLDRACADLGCPDSGR